MYSYKNERMYIEKEIFIRNIENAVIHDPRSEVVKIQYMRNFKGYPEVLMIMFKGGGYKYINITSNSNGANMRVITAAVYGGEYLGEIENGFK